VVVDQTHRLHRGVDDRRADEAEAAAAEVAAERLGLRRRRRHLGRRAEGVAPRPTAGEAPEIAVERAVLGLYLQEAAGVADRRRDLGAVAHDAGVGEEALHVALAEAGDGSRIEAGEGPPVAITAFEDRPPGEPRLRPLQHQELEERAVVVDRHPPLAVVVGDHAGLGAGPGTTGALAGGANHGCILQPDLC